MDPLGLATRKLISEESRAQCAIAVLRPAYSLGMGYAKESEIYPKSRGSCNGCGGVRSMVCR